MKEKKKDKKDKKKRKKTQTPKMSFSIINQTFLYLGFCPKNLFWLGTKKRAPQ